MRNAVIRLLVNVLALYLTVLLAERLGIGLALSGVWAAFLAVIILAVVNTLIRPLLIVLTLPLNCLTLGLFTIVINVLMFWLVGSLHLGFEVKNFLAALFGSIMMGIIAGLTNNLIGSRE